MFKFIHTGDLHIGKIVNEFSLLEDQKFFLEQIVEIAEREKADAVIIAGDIYDRAIPSADAVQIFDQFLSKLAGKNIPVLMISGNHDSAERIGFASEILKKQQVYIASSMEKGVKCVSITSRSKPEEQVCFVLLPFVKSAEVEAKNSQEAVKKLIDVALTDIKENGIDNQRKVLVTHYFVTNGDVTPELSDSETTVNVGGLDNVEAGVLEAFDYVALGHIHKAQQIGDRPIYYAGTPMKYSFSETNQTKSVNLVTMGDSIQVERLAIKALHDMRKIKGKLEELIRQEVVSLGDCNDYMQITLTNKEELIDPMGTLRSFYPNTMQMLLEKNQVQGGVIDVNQIRKSKTILELFQNFYEIVCMEPLPGDREKVVKQVINEIKE